MLYKSQINSKEMRMKLLASMAMVGLALAGAEARASALFEEDFTN